MVTETTDDYGCPAFDKIYRFDGSSDHKKLIESKYGIELDGSIDRPDHFEDLLY